MALLLTFISGLFFLIGIIVYRFVNHKKELTIGAFGCALIVIIGLIFFDLVPELIELARWQLIVWTIIGLLFLLLIDKLIPHHHHEHKKNDEETKEHQGHLEHITFITILALILHNIVESMALYSVSVSNLSSGMLMCLGIGLHNLPFGFQIASDKLSSLKITAIILLVLSSLIGGLLVLLFGTISDATTGIIISLTLGMLLYILLFELLPEVLRNIKQKATICGIIIGIIILIFINLI